MYRTEELRQSKWNYVKEYFSEYNRNSYFLRRDFIKKLGGGQTIETYRTYLTRAGYLEVVDHGVYKKVKNIPKEIKVREVYEKAYNSRNK